MHSILSWFSQLQSGQCNHAMLARHCQQANFCILTQSAGYLPAVTPAPANLQ